MGSPVLLEAEVEQVGGYVGQYRTMVRNKDGVRNELVHGTVVVATGALSLLAWVAGYAAR